ncbi:HI1506-related protein [Pseudoxanthomonas mexicana]|uniref:HI1506-related protein n=1 Tax=Pseudoxanthomonas mexicana TaxID=128785 RepID=UPI00398B9D7F
MTKEIPALFVRAKHEPYRRAGFQHTRAGTGFALDALTEAQVELLKNDPHLVVEECSFDQDAVTLESDPPPVMPVTPVDGGTTTKPAKRKKAK